MSRDLPRTGGPDDRQRTLRADRDAGSGRLEPCFRSDELEGKLIIEMKTKRIGDC